MNREFLVLGDIEKHRVKQWKANLELLPCHDLSSQVRELCFHLPLSLKTSKYQAKNLLNLITLLKV